MLEQLSEVNGYLCFFYKYYHFSLRKNWLTFGGHTNIKLSYFPVTKFIKKSEAISSFEKKYIYEKYNTSVILFKQ